MNVTTGLPRIIEIVDGRKTIKTPSMEVYINKEVKEEDVPKIIKQIKEIKVEDISDSFSMNLGDMTVDIELDREEMELADIDDAKLIARLSRGKINKKDIIIEENLLTVKLKSKKQDINKLYNLKETLRKTLIGGIKNVKQVLPVKRKDRIVIITGGTNLKKVLELPFVDKTKTSSNDLYEVREVFGVEAARQLIINEVSNVMETQGLDLDIRHIMLVADTICSSGKIEGITRYGIIKTKSSVLARASFETPIKHFINASISGEKDELNSVVENVMINQVVPVGTGITKLKVKNTKKSKK